MSSVLSSNQLRFLRGLNASGAEYMVIGGRAMQALGLSRRTSDLDVWVSHTGLSPDQLWAVLSDLIGKKADEHRERLREPNARLCIPNPENVEIDILTSVGDLSFDAMFANRGIKVLGAVQISVPSAAGLINTKEAGIASLMARIEVGTWAEDAVAGARCTIESDRQDIEALRRIE
jgi:hypothetical protein